jgi:type I restriction enzyme S subunit
VPVIGSSGIVGHHNESLIDGACLVVGRKGAAGAVHLVSKSSWPIDTAYFIQPPLGINLSYLYYFLSSQELGQLDKSTAIPSLSRDDLYVVEAPIAPEAEQTRIVDKLEELLSDLDAGVAELKAAQRKLAQYRQSLLKAAVEGALTADWRAARARSGEPQESGADLLQRILTERRARWEAKQLAKYAEQGKTPPRGWQAKYPEPVTPDVADLPTLPEGWAWASLDALVAESSYGTSVKCSYESTETPVLRIPNVSGGKVDLRDMKRSMQALPLDDRDYLTVGDILIIRTNGSIGLVGRAAAVTSELPTPHYFASYLLRLRCVDRVFLHRWVSSVLTAPRGRQWLEARAASSAGQHNISLSTLLTMPVPLPPAAEQTFALDVLADSMERCDEQEQATDWSISQAAAQRKNILQAAFAGQLVPQDPHDEPASALLERIRATRVAKGATARGKTVQKRKETS